MVQSDKGAKQDRRFWTAAELSKAYTSGQLTPSEVADSLIKRMEETQSMNWFIAYDAHHIHRQAAESTTR